MHIPAAIIVLIEIIVQCTICLAIRVPVDWDASEVKPVKLEDKPAPNDYFQYTANKPQFAVDVAKFHDVKSPEKHYESYPVQPHTGLTKPAFGKHQMLDSANQNYKPYQQYVQQDNNRHVSPVSNYYEVYHPYKEEIPALQAIYKDPVLNKIRNDVRDSKNRLQQYEHDAGESDVQKDEYLESPEATDKKRFPIRNKPVRYEVHRPQRRPIYYQPIPITNQREHHLNQKLKHPWNQNYAKVTPMHYRPLKHHLHRLRQQHAMTYDDERNEYPQIIPPEQYAEKPDGYDIFEKGKDNYNKIRNNFDESINKAVLKNRPTDKQNLEFKQENEENKAQDEEEFVPIKNYAQVRKTETYKHLPKSAAFRDAQNLEEYQNAPRLREAIKSSKNQVVYSEEGYEDSAYDHGGEQKHASDHEGHGGFLKEKESSKGKYKIPTIDIGFVDEGKTASREQVEHGEKWNDEKTGSQDENETEDYSEDENDFDVETDSEDITSAEYNERNKREDSNNQTNLRENSSENINDESKVEHEVAKREINLNVTEPNLKLSLPEKEIKRKILVDKYKSKLKKKYPYYFKDSKILNKNSPLRYAENLKLMPQKINSDTAFYNSRIALECPDVETEINPVPEKFEKDKVSNSDDSEDDDDDEEEENDKGEEEFKNFKNKQRLKGLGDKIDCLKAKYFGEDPLDSPFFKEDIINNPLPPSKPNSKIFTLPNSNLQQHTKNNLNNSNEPNLDILSLLNKLYDNNTFKNNITENISSKNESTGLKYDHHVNKESVTKMPHTLRNKRSATFMYEPYKVIKESQSQDSKKLTTNGNVSPLIKKLQTRQIIEKAGSNNQKQYKDIGKNDRPANPQETTFVDVSVDQRRGEPRYELDLGNHKSVYSPVENRSSISVDDYKKKISNVNNSDKYMESNNKEVTNRPYFDVSKYLPQTIVTQNIAASNKVEKVVRSSTSKPQTENDENDEDDDYEEYDEEEDEDEVTTTTTTKKPTKIRIRLTTTVKPDVNEQSETPKLRLITRFHTTSTTEKPIEKMNDDKYHNRDDNTRSPKYREKKKKSTKSTLVTDTESYGDDDDDMREKEIDAMIGVQHDMDEYRPMYEKEEKRKLSSRQHKNDSDENEHDHHDEDDDDDDEDEDEEDDDDDDDDEEDEEVDEKTNHHEDKHYKEKERVSTSNEKVKVETTTSEPTKRTLLRTTEPTATTEVLNKMNEQRPTIFRKKIEIHKELPVDKKSPHVTHFKQDIKEVEVVKEMEEPKKKVLKNLEALELYRDDNLAKDINQLGGVEIFRDDIDLESGPRHGGNYRSIKPEELRQENESSNVDVEASQSETKSTVQVEPATARPRLRSDVIRSRNVRNRNAKIIDRSGPKPETTTISTREENLRKLRRNRNENAKSAKLIEFQDENVEDHPRSMHGGNFRTYNTRNNNRPMHGGNYRSAKIVQAPTTTSTTTSTTTVRPTPTRNRNNEAELLNTFARVVPELTTPPAFILDPSKRQYYYVD
ncbi:stress response protein NST1-like [Colias croceus]|uniref:stress response protein NST1-like n=1 Tax=Colias crocea TaxID=72248 RepID=UPI001E27BCB4|nr:stress response protein NST1-like [Colias croceus]